MAFIEWSDANRVGVTDVDEQHKQLFGILNQLHAAVAEGKEQSELHEIVERLIEYTVYHFRTEEDLFLEHGYPGYDEQKSEHDSLTATALEFQGKLLDGSATLSFELLDFLHDWLMDHTMGLDKEMGTFFNERGIL